MCYPKSEGGMGFRDLYSFNLAMLSKQCWRLITNPDSLCAHVLKAKYYPNISLLQATLKNGASFTWQSVMKGLETFKLGYIWRIGTGETVNIWNDPWVPASPDRKVISGRGQSILTSVNELIDPNTGMWDEELICSIFNPVDVGRILQIPINNNTFEDFIAWHPERKGIFSVRSAYRVQWQRSFQAHANMIARLAGSQTLEIWRKLWKLMIPHKVSIFCWRALHGIIPLKSILVNWHVGTDDGCPICHGAAEDIKHLLFGCTHAKELWRNLGILQIVEEAMEVDRSGSVVLENLLLMNDRPIPLKPSLDVKQVIVVGGWYLWWIRRELTHNGSPPLPSRWPMSVLAIANNFHEANKKSRENHVQRWLKPNPKFMKVNVDAAFYENERAGATAAVIHDDKGNFLAAQCKFLTHAANVVTSEAIAMRDGLAFANSLGF